VVLLVTIIQSVKIRLNSWLEYLESALRFVLQNVSHFIGLCRGGAAYWSSGECQGYMILWVGYVKPRFIEHYVSGDYQFFYVGIVDSVCLGGIIIAHKYSQLSSQLKFVPLGLVQVNICGTQKYGDAAGLVFYHEILLLGLDLSLL
jgi:hypothetical protein